MNTFIVPCVVGTCSLCSPALLFLLILSLWASSSPFPRVVVAHPSNCDHAELESPPSSSPHLEKVGPNPFPPPEFLIPLLSCLCCCSHSLSCVFANPNNNKHHYRFRAIYGNVHTNCCGGQRGSFDSLLTHPDMFLGRTDELVNDGGGVWVDVWWFFRSSNSVLSSVLLSFVVSDSHKHNKLLAGPGSLSS